MVLTVTPLQTMDRKRKWCSFTTAYKIPDLKPYDFFLFSSLKYLVYSTYSIICKIYTHRQLIFKKKNKAETIYRLHFNFFRRINFWLQENGDHSQHLLCCLFKTELTYRAKVTLTQGVYFVHNFTYMLLSTSVILIFKSISITTKNWLD